MSIATDVSRIKGNITAALAAIAGKGVNVPDGSTSDALAELIMSIPTSSGDIKIEQGSVTFAEEQSSYTFVTDSPDIFIAYVEDDSKPVYSSSNYIWMIIQDTRLFNYYGNMRKTSYILGYNKGSKKYYTPVKTECTSIGRFISTDFNSCLGAKTYKWYAIYGVTAT